MVCTDASTLSQVCGMFAKSDDRESEFLCANRPGPESCRCPVDIAKWAQTGMVQWVAQY